MSVLVMQHAYIGKYICTHTHTHIYNWCPYDWKKITIHNLKSLKSFLSIKVVRKNIFHFWKSKNRKNILKKEEKDEKKVHTYIHQTTITSKNAILVFCMTNVYKNTYGERIFVIVLWSKSVCKTLITVTSHIWKHVF